MVSTTTKYYLKSARSGVVATFAVLLALFANEMYNFTTAIVILCVAVPFSLAAYLFIDRPRVRKLRERD